MCFASGLVSKFHVIQTWVHISNVISKHFFWEHHFQNKVHSKSVVFVPFNKSVVFIPVIMLLEHNIISM